MKFFIFFLAGVFTHNIWADPTDEVKVKVLPSPVSTDDIVVTNPNGSTTSFAKNWFSFQLAIDNATDLKDPSSASLTISQVEVMVSDDSDGGMLAFQYFDASQNNYTTPFGKSCAYADYGQFDRGGVQLADLITIDNSFPHSGVNRDRLFSLPSDTGGVCQIQSPTFYVGGLPSANDGSHKYSVTVIPIGTFGTRSASGSYFSQSVTVHIE
jgi:hypothetical protein